MAVNCLEGRELVFYLREIGEALDGDDREIEILAVEPEGAHIRADELGALVRIDLCAREREHMGGDIDADNGKARLSQWHQHAPTAARHFEHPAALRAGKLQIERQVGVERKNVVQLCQSRVAPRLLRSQDDAIVSFPVRAHLSKGYPQLPRRRWYASCARRSAVSLQTAQRLSHRYLLLEPIGYGGMGRVFRGRDELLDRDVAIKLLDQSSLEPSGLAEARAAARVSHPAVVRIFDVGVAEGTGQGYIVMELAAGRPLREILRERAPLAADEAARLASQIADALQAIHELGMVHCDVKPLNVIVTPVGDIKLVDFGIARASTTAGERIGSATYLAPEQVRGEPLDGRTDVYALGAVLYEMLVGTAPFPGDVPADVAAARLAVDPPPPRSINPRVPSALAAIAMRALNREPAGRYASADEMRQALNAAVDRSSSATQPLPEVRPRVSAPRSRESRARVGARVVRPRITAMRPAIERPNVFVVLAVIAILVLGIAGWRVTHPPTPGVPHLVGLRLSEVPAALEQAGIAPADTVILTRRVEAEYVGTVVDQQPQPGLPRDPDGVQIAVGVSR